MAQDERIRVLLADDHRLVREALRIVLERDCEIVAEAATGEEAVALAAKTKPHVVVLDIEMPGLGGLAAAHQLAKGLPATKVLILSQYQDEEYVLEALSEAQAAGYMVKTDAASELLNAVRAVRSGKRYLSPSIAPIVLSRLAHPVASAGQNQSHLSRRERQVLRLISEGATSKEIAASSTSKLNLRSTAAMVRYAIKRKLIRID
jgi:DNA-binding NarL/FixJ family response regulator